MRTDGIPAPHKFRLGALMGYLKAKALTGPILEFGVYGGNSLSHMYTINRSLGLSNQFIGFDSFAGLPSSEDCWEKGTYHCSLQECQNALLQEGCTDVQLISGLYDITLTSDLKKSLKLTSPSLIHIDCDLYSSTKTVLAWCEDLIKSETIICFDEFCNGEDRAWEESSISSRAEVLFHAGNQKAFRINV